MSIRRGALIIPKYSYGRPTDHVFSNRIWSWFPEFVAQLLSVILMWLSQGRVFLGKFPGLHLIHPTVNLHMLDKVKDGSVIVKPSS